MTDGLGSESGPTGEERIKSDRPIAFSLTDILNASVTAEHALERLVEEFPRMTTADLVSAIKVEILELAWDEAPHQSTFLRANEVLVLLLYNHESVSVLSPLRSAVRESCDLEGMRRAASRTATLLDSPGGGA